MFVKNVFTQIGTLLERELFGGSTSFSRIHYCHRESRRFSLGEIVTSRKFSKCDVEETGEIRGTGGAQKKNDRGGAVGGGS